MGGARSIDARTEKMPRPSESEACSTPPTPDIFHPQPHLILTPRSQAYAPFHLIPSYHTLLATTHPHVLTVQNTEALSANLSIPGLFDVADKIVVISGGGSGIDEGDLGGGLK